MDWVGLGWCGVVGGEEVKGGWMDGVGSGMDGEEGGMEGMGWEWEWMMEEGWGESGGEGFRWTVDGWLWLWE